LGTARRDRAFAKEWETQPERVIRRSRGKRCHTKAAIKQYATLSRERMASIADNELRTGLITQQFVQLRRRLRPRAISKLRRLSGKSTISYVENAVKKAQARHGIPPTGFSIKIRSRR